MLLKKQQNGQNILNNRIYYYFLHLQTFNSVLKDNFASGFDKRDINECIRNYTKILLGNEFLETYEMLFRNTKPTKTKKAIKHIIHKKTKSKS